MIEKCKVKLNKNHPGDTLSTLVNLADKYTKWLDYEVNVARGIVESIKYTTPSQVDEAIEIFNYHFKEYVELEIT